MEDIIKQLMTKFGQDETLTTCRGKILDYLGMKIDYRRKGKVTFSMENYIKQILEDAPFDMEGTAKTTATCNLFNVNDGARKLEEKKAQLFHHLVAKLLYLCRRTRQDIQMAVAFLCTRVKSPDKDDYKKTNTSNTVPKGYDKNDAYHRTRQQSTLVGGQFLCCSPGHEEPYRHIYVYR